LREGWSNMLEILQSLTPEQRAAVVGLLVTGVVYLGRHIAPSLFCDQGDAAKFQRTVSVVLLSGLGALLSATPWHGAAAFLLSWGVTYATAEGAHTVVARSTALTNPNSPAPCAEVKP
jgi:hypothetical protein